MAPHRKLTLVLFACCFTLWNCRHADILQSKGRADNPTPQVAIVLPPDGAVIRGSDVDVEIATASFEFAYQKATTPGTMTTLPERYADVPQEPNSGHVHVYLAAYPARDVRPQHFLMVKSFYMPNAARFTLHEVPPGRYRLLVELTNHDHTPRIKKHPTDWPPLDVVNITVEGAPASN